MSKYDLSLLVGLALLTIIANSLVVIAVLILCFRARSNKATETHRVTINRKPIWYDKKMKANELQGNLRIWTVRLTDGQTTLFNSAEPESRCIEIGIVSRVDAFGRLEEWFEAIMIQVVAARESVCEKGLV